MGHLFDLPGLRNLAPRVLENADFANLLSDGEPTLATQGPSLFGAAVRMFGSLALVLALLIFSLWLLRRFGNRWVPGAAKSAAADRIQVLHHQPLGGRRQLTEIRWRGRHYLLGVTPEQITALAAEPNAFGPEDMDAFDPALSEALDDFGGAPELVAVGDEQDALR
jgi:flagellar biosynthetic protein FliO